VDAFGMKLVAVGDTIYSMHPHATARDAFREHLRFVLGADWWEEQAKKHPMARHPIARWHAHVEELINNAERDDLGRSLVDADGIFTAYMTLAYDLWIVRDNIRFEASIVDRLRRREAFAGVRYELLVAETFVRANFAVEPEDETDSQTKHAEFVTTHRDTGLAIAVEAKARDRRPSDRNPTKVGMADHLTNAAKKASRDKPYAVFVDVAMPPHQEQKPNWLDEIATDLEDVVAKNGGLPGPFD
jgi:hypothetical protein